MNLFGLSAVVHGRERMEEFLEDCFVSIGYPGIGDPESADAQEVSKRLNRVYGYEGRELAGRLAAVETFVRGMQDGDFVLVPYGGHVWLGDLGDYYYRGDYDDEEQGTCHRRGVTWLGVLPEEALNPALRQFAAAVPVGAVMRFDRPADEAGLEGFAAQAPGGAGLPGPGAAAAQPRGQGPGRAEAEDSADLAAAVTEAVAVLREVLRGGDAELRVRAAEALLRYAGGK
ncbi:hypothetical protein QWJ34_00275 [Saccharibacillus sp. CPCC 101409]|uniref:hypothetical protein n=1 Tax=Saccharibacillus sp. CPCC 101409 TaxID=3058041 RepID=UPI002673319F|nr:hypothetical protein [Saccharibacillus sp. CPCC 101409]MDO3408192.1 hypothetical protein [Saccharibacillus sp. CPCC 101409]